MLPFGWTVETLLSAHVLKPYNPDIARVFYRAGYIESWGRGIQKIRDACKNLGAKEPEYIVHGEDIMVKFSALQSTEILNSKAQDVTKDVTKDISIEIKILLKDALTNQTDDREVYLKGIDTSYYYEGDNVYMRKTCRQVNLAR